MRIFITGASGYIGSAVAKALRRAGHEVIGLVRSAVKATPLHQEEIQTVIGTLQQPETYLDHARECTVLVHAAADYQAGMAATESEAIKTLIIAAQGGPRPKTIVYTSGVWIYGNTGDRAVDETTPLKPVQHVAWRSEAEQMILRATGVRSLILRPGCVYGKQGGLSSEWFGAAFRGGPLKVIGDGTNRWTMVHADDLADAYVRAVESNYSGEIFNVTDRSRFTVAEMARAAAHAAGHSGDLQLIPVAEAAKTMGTFAECLALDQHVDSRKAVRLLGWQPRHGGFVDGVDSYFTSWKASAQPQ